MKKRNKIIDSCVKKGITLLVMLAVVSVSLLWNTAQKVHAQYIFYMTGASRGGTVTIEPVKGASVNGYYKPEGYQVTYTVTNESWTAFDGNYGGFFYMGDNLNPSGGCSFAYAPSGIAQEAGAIQLGNLAGGTLIARGDVASGSTSCTFQVNSLDELPTYIAYCYQPASGAYLHITEEYGQSYHVWYYQNLAGTTVSYTPQTDIDGPAVTTGTTPVGEAVERNGKTWSKGVHVNVTAQDAKSGSGGVCFYQNNILKKEIVNNGQSTSMTASYEVNANGTFQVQAYDRLGNKSTKKTVTVNSIDDSAPMIDSMTAGEEAFCIENKITVDSNDAGVGLADLAYCWNDEEWTASPMYVAKENGTYTVKVRDALGNEADSSIEISNIDNKPPVIKKVEETVIQNGEVRIMVTAADNEGGIGLHEKPYSFDGGKTWQTEPYIKVEENGTYQVLVRDALELCAKADIEITSFQEVKGGGDEEPFTPDKPVEPTTPDMPVTPDTPITPGISDTPGHVDVSDISDVSDDEEESADVSGIEIISRPFIPRVKENTVVVENEKLLNEADEEPVETILKPQPIQSDPMQKAVLAVLFSLLIIGIIGLTLYLLLFWLRYSCVLYGVDDKQERERICRLRVRRFDTDWQVKIPDDKLGDHGTGKYVLTFHASFVKDEIPAAVIVVIDNRSLREELAEEIAFRI